MTDTNFISNQEGLEFIALKDLTTDELVKQLAKQRVMIKISDGFGIIAFAGETDQTKLAWVATKVAQS